MVNGQPYGHLQVGTEWGDNILHRIFGDRCRGQGAGIPKGHVISAGGSCHIFTASKLPEDVASDFTDNYFRNIGRLHIECHYESIYGDRQIASTRGSLKYRDSALFRIRSHHSNLNG